MCLSFPSEMETLKKMGVSEVFHGDLGFQGSFGGVGRVRWGREEMGRGGVSNGG